MLPYSEKHIPQTPALQLLVALGYRHMMATKDNKVAV